MAARTRRHTLLRVGLPLLVMAVPVGLYYWLVASYGVNVPDGDTWNGTLPLLADFSGGHLTLAELWAPHNENRLLVPNTILILLDSATHMNQVVDLLVSATMLVAGVIILCWLAARTLRLSPAWVAPLPFVLLSFVQTENALNAIQLSWTVIILLTAVALAVLEVAERRWILFAAAALAAALASFSSLQGLLVWPVGLVYGTAAGWRRSQAVVWVVLAAGAAVLYAHDFGPVVPSAPPGEVFRHPLVSVEFFLLLVGAPFAFHRPVMGAVMLCVLVATVLAAVRAEPWRRFRVPGALVLLALLFDGLVTVGRVGMGTGEAASPRYTSYNLMLLAGTYLLAVAAARSRLSGRRPSWSWGGDSLRALPLATCALLAVCQLGLGLNAGLRQAQGMSASLRQGAALLRDYRDASTAQLAADLFQPSGDYVKQWAPVLEAHRWSVFSTPAAPEAASGSYLSYIVDSR